MGLGVVLYLDGLVYRRIYAGDARRHGRSQRQCPIQINHRDYPETQNPYDVVPEAAAGSRNCAPDGIKTVAPGQAPPCSQDDDKAAPGKLMGVDRRAGRMTELDQRIEEGAWLSAEGQAVIELGCRQDS